MQINTVKQKQSGYILNSSITVPDDALNADYQAIQKWIEEGGQIESYDELADLKIAKISEMKSARDTANIEPIVDTQAELLNSEGSATGVMSYFKFYTNRHATNPASDPTSILIGVILKNSAISYYTQTLEGENIVVNLTPEIAQSLVSHLSVRNDGNYSLYRAIETAINSASTKEEVEAITWNPSYLGN